MTRFADDACFDEHPVYKTPVMFFKRRPPSDNEEWPNDLLVSLHALNIRADDYKKMYHASNGAHGFTLQKVLRNQDNRSYFGAPPAKLPHERTEDEQKAHDRFNNHWTDIVDKRLKEDVTKCADRVERDIDWPLVHTEVEDAQRTRTAELLKQYYVEPREATEQAVLRAKRFHGMGQAVDNAGNARVAEHGIRHWAQVQLSVLSVSSAVDR